MPPSFSPAMAATAIGVLLWTRPATGDPAPALSAVGKAHLAVAAGIVVTSAIHLAHLLGHRRQAAGQRRADTATADTGRGHTAADQVAPDVPPGSTIPFAQVTRRAGDVVAGLLGIVTRRRLPVSMSSTGSSRRAGTSRRRGASTR